jgi:enterochelin esterase family protein
MKERLCLPALAFLLVSLTLTPDGAGQFPRREPTPNDTLESVEVLDDNRVTFRIYAPKADEVSISGDWMGQGLGSGGNLEKDEEGVWSITVGPLPADFYSYSFVVDGVKTLDPKSAMVKQGISSLDNMFLLPGEEASFEVNQPVPHGEIRQVWYDTSTLGTERRMHVYTPPGYDASDEQYPVLYLLHGGGDEDSGWSTIGRAGCILDNLLAAGKAQPMLVVMPNGSLPRPAERTPDGPEEPSPEERSARRAAMQNRFTNELVADVVPFVEKNYRVRPGPESRALAGLSMGGGQTLRVLTTHPDKFAYVGIWSAGLFGASADEWEAQNEDFLGAAEKVNDAVKHLEIVVGDRDFALDGSRSLAGLFEKRGIEHELRITGGGHTWINWRQYLRDFSQKIFQQRADQADDLPDRPKAIEPENTAQ